MNQEFSYENQPYVAELMKFINANPAKPGLCHVVIEHDDWCSALLGTGPCICRPVVRTANRKERRKLKATSKPSRVSP